MRVLEATAEEIDFDTSWDPAGRSAREIARDFHYAREHEAFYNAWSDPADATMHGVQLQHGDVVRVDGATVRVVSTPGHAENHAAFCLVEEQSIFSGDHVLGYGTTVMRDLYDYMASLEAMRRYRPVRLYPGHGPYIADGTGLLDRYMAHRQAREDQVVTWLEDAAPLQTARDIAEALYTNTSLKQMRQAQENIERILIKLWRDGRALAFSDRSGATSASLPLNGYIDRLDAHISWRMISQGDDATERWSRKVQSIVRATDADCPLAVNDIDMRVNDGCGVDSEAQTPTAKL